MNGLSPRKTFLIRGFIILWLLLQILIPFFRKFDFPNFRYRYATFSWAMYSKPALVYQVSFFRKNTAGEREGIPDIKKYVREYRSPEPMLLHDYYRTKAQIQDWNTRLVTAIGNDKKDGRVYGVSIHWNTKLTASDPQDWEFKTTAGEML